MRGLEDTRNPYRGSYQAWDRWALANARDYRLVDWTAWNAGQAGPGLRMIYVHVDGKGYPVPILEDYKRQVQAAHAPEANSQQACNLSFMAYGEMPAELLDGLTAAEMEYKAQFVPRIPAWLADNPPQWALLLPDGEVVTAGELGAGSEIDPFYTWVNSWNLPQQPYQRYSADGKLLGKLKQGDDDWYKLFWKQAPQVVDASIRSDSMKEFYNGYIILKRYQGQNIIAIYDYNGNELPASVDPKLRDSNTWGGFIGREINALYKAQQRINSDAGIQNNG